MSHGMTFSGDLASFEFHHSPTRTVTEVFGDTAVTTYLPTAPGWAVSCTVDHGGSPCPWKLEQPHTPTDEADPLPPEEDDGVEDGAAQDDDDTPDPDDDLTDE